MAWYYAALAQPAHQLQPLLGVQPVLPRGAQLRLAHGLAGVVGQRAGRGLARVGVEFGARQAERDESGRRRLAGGVYARIAQVLGACAERDALAVTLGGGGDEVVQQIAGARDRVQHAGLKARHNHCSSPEV